MTTQMWESSLDEFEAAIDAYSEVLAALDSPTPPSGIIEVLDTLPTPLVPIDAGPVPAELQPRLLELLDRHTQILAAAESLTDDIGNRLAAGDQRFTQGS